MPQFKTIQVLVDAIQYNGVNTSELEVMAGSSENIGGQVGQTVAIFSPTGGVTYARPGDWVIRDPDGNLHVHRPDDFQKIFTPA